MVQQLRRQILQELWKVVVLLVFCFSLLFLHVCLTVCLPVSPSLSSVFLSIILCVFVCLPVCVNILPLCSLLSQSFQVFRGNTLAPFHET